jgi:multidrug efflux system membrane fusion protein
VRLAKPLLLLLVVASGCRPKREPEPTPPAAVLVSVAHPVEEEPLQRRAVVAAAARLRLGFAAPGRIEKMLVKVGDVVQEGQLLATLQSADAKAALKAARARHRTVRRDLRTTRDLAGVGALSERQRDGAELSVKLAEAEATLASEALAQRALVAPAAGVISARLAEPGETVAPGAPVLMLDDDSRTVVRIGVNSRELASLALGQRALLRADGDTSAVEGHIETLAPAPGDEGLHAVELTVDAHALWPLGTMLEVQLGQHAAGSLSIPLDAVVHAADRTYVFVLDAASASPRVRRRELVLGHGQGRHVRVESGLTEGERYVSEGAQFLSDGQRIEILDPARASL